MKILVLEWNSYGNKDMKEAFVELGHKVTGCPFPNGILTTQGEADQILREALRKEKYDFVFSFNYIPVVSICCEEAQTLYVSWVYDSPYIHVYSYTVLNPCNYIFLFDHAVYEELKAEGIPTVYYLPLAVNERRLCNLTENDIIRQKYQTDIAFVGSLYDEPKHRLYDRFQNVRPYAKGYLDGVIQAQKRIYGYNFLKQLLTADIVEEMQKAYPTDPNAKTVMKPEEIYAEYVLARQVTALERREILSLLGEKYGVRLYTNNKDTRIAGVENLGPVDYYEEMPYVFSHSKINLNITLKSIKTGIPLRCFDIMGCGGFLLSNYQSELAQYFEPDADFVYYEDYDDLMKKTAYYLERDKERQEIAANGARKVRMEHTMKNRIGQMIDTIHPS